MTSAPMAVAPAQSRTILRTTESGDFLMSDYLGEHSDGSATGGFQAYLVGQKAEKLRPHYHEVDQFQVVLDGSGRLGRHAIGAGTVHYSDAYTVYGPIFADAPDGLSYFTLRLDPAAGLNYMPESRVKGETRAGEHFTCAIDDVAGETGKLDLLARTRRGAAAFGVALDLGGVLTADALAECVGRGYAVVLSGSVAFGDRTLPSGSLIPFESAVALEGLSGQSDRTNLALVVFATLSELTQ